MRELTGNIASEFSRPQARLEATARAQVQSTLFITGLEKYEALYEAAKNANTVPYMYYDEYVEDIPGMRKWTGRVLRRLMSCDEYRVHLNLNRRGQRSW